MRQREKFNISLGLMLLAYGYAVTGYALPSLVCGISAAVIAVCSHSIRCLRSHMLWILSFSLIEIIVIRALAIDHNLPTLSALTLCNAVFASCSCDSSYRTIHSTLRIQLICLLAFLLAVLILPASWLIFLMPVLTVSRMLECVLVLFIFAPLLIQNYARQKRHFNHQNTMRVIDDKLVSGAVK